MPAHLSLAHARPGHYNAVVACGCWRERAGLLVWADEFVRLPPMPHKRISQSQRNMPSHFLAALAVFPLLVLRVCFDNTSLRWSSKRANGREADGFCCVLTETTSCVPPNPQPYLLR